MSGTGSGSIWRMRIYGAIAGILLLSCGGGDEACEEGFGRAEDGNCYPLEDSDDDDDDTDSSLPDPTIEIVSPATSTEIALNDNCAFELAVTVEVENLELLDPSAANGVDAGQGHWHLQMSVPDRGYMVVSTLTGQMFEEDLSPGEIVTIRASLQSNVHEELQSDGAQDVIEVTIGDAPTAVCP